MWPRALAAGAIGPGEQLLARGGAEGVGGGEQHLLRRSRPGGGRACRSLVVLPAPLTPTTMITVGVCSPITSRRSSGCSSSSMHCASSAAPSPDRARGRASRRLQLVEEIDRRIERRRRPAAARPRGPRRSSVADLGTDEGAGDRAAGALQAALELGHPAGPIGGGLLHVRRGGACRRAMSRRRAEPSARRRRRHASRGRGGSEAASGGDSGVVATAGAPAQTAPASCRRTARRRPRSASQSLPR